MNRFFDKQNLFFLAPYTTQDEHYLAYARLRFYNLSFHTGQSVFYTLAHGACVKEFDSYPTAKGNKTKVKSVQIG